MINEEPQRSIYQIYQALFEYFDALLLGLTATPKDNIHHNTYEIFGLPDKTPTDAYSFDEAVAEGYLVPYHVVEAPTRFMRSEEHTSELQSRGHLVCRLLLEKK